MARTFWVMLTHKRMPTVDALSRYLKDRQLPLEFSEQWTQESPPEWLPMRWRGAETGCETEFESLSLHYMDDLRDGGFGEFDTALSISAEDLVSLQAGACFGAAIATLAGGSISPSNEDNQFIGTADALAWARQLISETEPNIVRERERRDARARVEANGDIGASLEQSLAALAGAKVKQVERVKHHLGVVLEGGQDISGSAWRLVTRSGQCIVQDHHANELARQSALAAKPEGTSPPPALADLHQQLEAAERQDESAMRAGMAEFNGWPKGTLIEALSWQRPDTIRLRFAGGMTIEFVAKPLSRIICRAHPLSFWLDGERVHLF